MQLGAQQDERWAPESNGTWRFTTVHVFVESGTQPLAAYQLSLNVTGGDARIVGVEGGEPGAFQQAPHFDPKAIQQQRVILAAFSTSDPQRLPQGKVRVATIHLQLKKNSSPRYQITLQTAAGADGRRITAAGRLEERSEK